MKYALLRNSDNALLSVSDYPADWSPENVAHKFGPEFEARFVPVLDEATPEFNVATHHLERNDRLEDGQWKRGFNVVALPPPDAVTTWALVEELQSRGMWATVQALINALPAGDKFAAENRLLRAETIRRDHELTQGIIAALQLSEATADEIFIAAKVRAAS
jgi:hypothetical protein